MKKVILFILIIFLSSAVFAQSNHTITIDGTKDAWNSVETFTDVSHDGYSGTATKEAYLTWDADYIYFAIQDDEADYEKLATFMYFDVDNSGGNREVYAWGENILTPFACDYVIVWKNKNLDEYIEVRQWDASSWSWQKVASANYTSSLSDGDYVVDFGVTDGNDYREVRVKRSTIGNPSEFKFCSFTEQQWGNYHRYFAFPNEGWTDADRLAEQEIQHYRGYTLSGGYDPNDDNAYDYVMRKNSAFISYDGNDDFVKLSDNATLGKLDGASDYTLEAWIYPRDGVVAEYDRVFQRYYSFAIVMFDGNNDSKVKDWYFQVYDKVNLAWKYYNTEGDATLTLDAWNHIAVINNSSDGTLKLYVGSTDVTTTGGYSNRNMPSATASDNLYIGSKKTSTPNNSFGGYIDELRLKNVAENPADLHTSINDNAYMLDDNTAALLHFDEGSGGTTLDLADNRDASLNNVPTWLTPATGLPLPVELTSFTASSIGSATVLNWETATEVNNYGFEIQSSVGQKSFLSIGFVNGHGNSSTPQSYSFVATDGAKQYRLKQIDTDGSFEYSDVVEVEANLSYKLYQNHPNPFNPTTQINFSIPEAAKVTITVFNALGQEVAELANREFSVGNHTVNFNASTSSATASNLTSGIYFYRMNSANFSQTMKMLLLK